MGNNQYGQLGDADTTTTRSTPTPIANNVKAAAVGWYHSLYITNTGELHAMGRNNSGQLGDGATTDRTTPTPIPSTYRHLIKLNFAVNAQDRAYHIPVVTQDAMT
jgi:alpha-tubulin suppressor-like RCC1 family protein